MKLATFNSGGTQHWGAVVGDGIVDLGKRLTGVPTLKALIEAGPTALSQAKAQEGVKPDYKLSEVELVVPVQGADKILCIGVNYANRNAEYKDGSDLPKYPSMFPRFAGSFTGHGRPLTLPPESPQLDYEGEIVLVIGKTVRRASKEEALGCIWGLTIMNEGTIRDWTKHAKFNVTQGKNWDASGSIGPWIVTADEFKEGYGDLRVQTRVNGELRQNDSTENLMFDFAYLISYISTFATLHPGDMISTGTPIGAGVRFDPPKYLKEGDVVEVEVSGIGTLSNGIQAEVLGKAAA